MWFSISFGIELQRGVYALKLLFGAGLCLDVWLCFLYICQVSDNCMGFVDRARSKGSPRCVEFLSTHANKSRSRRSSRYNALWLTRVNFFLIADFLFRFAEFVEGKSHLSDREVLDYETSALIPRETDTWTDDESDDE